MTADSHAPASPLNWKPLSPGWLASGKEYDYLIHRDNGTGRLVLARCRRFTAHPGNEMAMVREIMATSVEMYDPEPAKRLAEDYEAGRTCVLGEEGGSGTPVAWRQMHPRHSDIADRSPRRDRRVDAWSPGQTLGEMTPAARDAAVRRAAARYQGELNQVAPHLGEAIGQAEAEAEAGREDAQPAETPDPALVYGGFTHDQLYDAFELVKPAENWKYPIDAVVPEGTDLQAVSAALLFYAGSPAEFMPVPGGTRVVAAGYYACIGG